MTQQTEQSRRSANWDLSAGPDNYAALVLGQLAGALLSFWALSIVSGALTASGYGRVVSIFAISLGAAQIALQWTLLSLYRYGSQEFVETGRIATSFWTRLSLLAASGVVVAATAPIWFPHLALWLGLPADAAWLVPIHVFATVISTHVQFALLATKQPRFQSLSSVVSRTFLVSVLLFLTHSTGLSWQAATLLYSLSPLLEATLGLAKIGKLIGPGISVDLRLARTMLRFSLPLTVNGLVGYLSTNYLDAFFILKLLSQSQLGVYSLAYQLAGTLMQLATAAGSLLLPFFVSLGVEGRSERLSYYFRELLPVLALIWSGACIVFVVVGSLLIETFFEPSFAESAELLWPLGAAAALAGPVLLGFGALINAKSATFISAYLATAAAAVNVLLNVVLIPRFGLSGCAWATVAAYAAGTIVAIVASRRLVDVRLHWYVPALVPAVVAAALAGMDTVVGAAAGASLLLIVGIVQRRRVVRCLVQLSRRLEIRPIEPVEGEQDA